MIQISNRVLRIAVVSLIIIDLSQFVYIRKMSMNMVNAASQMQAIKEKCVDRLNSIDGHLNTIESKEKLHDR